VYKFQRQDAHTILLYIDSYHMDIPEGRFFCPCTGETEAFRGVVQMLLKIEQCLDIHNAPQGFHTIRRFSHFPSFWPLPLEETGTQPGQSASFSLQILFRRNASWQGSVTWLEKDRTMHFRSALELIFLLCSSLTGLPAEEWEQRDICLEG